MIGHKLYFSILASSSFTALSQAAYHDVLYERSDLTWLMRVSAYQKLRLSSEWVIKALQSEGFLVDIEQGIAGMIRVVSTMPN